MTKIKNLDENIDWLEKERDLLLGEKETTIKFLNSQKVSNLTELGNKIAGLENGLAGEQQNNIWFKKQIDTAVNEWKAADLKDLSKITRTFFDERNNLDKELKAEKEAKETQKISYTKQLNQVNKSLTEEKDKVKKLTEKEVELSDELTKRGKKIDKLELTNKTLTESYKKLVQFFADARLLIAHLKEDLATEKKEKTELQQDIAGLEEKVKD